MRFIQLENSAIKVLEKIYHSHSKSHVRQRAQCLLLSHKGYSVPKLADIFSTRTHTIRAWFNRWEEEGAIGLEIRPGRGLKPAISLEDTAFVSDIKQELSLDPHNLRQVVERLNLRWGKSLTVKQIKTFIKKNLNIVGVVLRNV
jgi:transposase